MLFYEIRKRLTLLEPPSGISSEKWGEKNRELLRETSAFPGPWSLRLIPFMRPILEALDDDRIETVVIEKATQISGSETVLTWLMRRAVESPGPTMWVFADESTAQTFMETRVILAFKTCPAMQDLIDVRKITQNGIILKNGFTLTMAWASSIPKTASIPIRDLILDEITKPAYGQIGAEGAAINRIIQRTEAFPDRKIVMLSSVTTENDNMQKQMKLCDTVYDWGVPCPHCGDIQPMKFRESKSDEAKTGRVTFPKDGTNEERASLARYQCRSCDMPWTTEQKNASVSKGVSIARFSGTGIKKRVGFHVSRLLSLFPGGSFESLVLSFLQAGSDLAELQSFVNNALAEYWLVRIATTSQMELEKAKCDLEPGTVPEDAVAVNITLDTQNIGFYYVVRAWNRFHRSWLLEYGFIEDWNKVDDLCFKRLWPQGEKLIPSWRIMIDIGGGIRESGRSATEEVMDWKIENRFKKEIFLAKGASRQLSGKLQMGKPLETLPSGKRPKHPIQIVMIDTFKCKNEYHDRIKKAQEGKDGAYLHKNTDHNYFNQITSEELRIEDGQHVWVQVGKDNHYLDCESMQMACASRELQGGVYGLSVSPQRIQPQAQKTPTPTNQPDNRPQENPYLTGMEPENPYLRRY